MWRWTVSALVLWNTITSQPISSDPSNDRPPHPLGIECCPCPDSNATGNQLVTDAAVAPSRTREVSVDDCPCQFRGSDAEGSPSFFLPRAVHPVRTLLKPADHQEDSKPLLRPEVDLASSVLETLREATDEEYREALARDAVRNATKDDSILETTPPSESAKNIVIVLNPSDTDNDAIPEASNTQKVHFAYPSSRFSLGKVSDEPLRGIFKVNPKLIQRKIADMDEGASNVQENVAISRDLDGLRLKADPSILKLFPKPKSVHSGNLKSLFKLRESNFKSSSNDDSTKSVGIAPAMRKIPELKLGSTLKKLSQPRQLKTLNFTVPKLSLAKDWKQNNDLIDSNTAPSNVDEQFVEVTKGRNVPRLGLPSLLPLDLSATRRAPFAFKNLLKLKDVELIPPRITKVNIELPSLKPVTKNKGKLFSSRSNKDCDVEKKFPTQSNIQLIPRGKKGKTEILDALPSASENNPLITTNGNSVEQQDSLTENSNGDTTKNTGQQFTDDFEAVTPNNEETELNHDIEHNPTQLLSKVPEDGAQDIDSYDDNIEIMLSENGDSGIEQIVFDLENEPSNSEIKIGVESIPELEEDNETVDVSALDIDQSNFSEGSDFGGIVNEDEEIIASDHIVNSDSVVLEKEAEEQRNVPADSSSAATCDCQAKTMPDEEKPFFDENRNTEAITLNETPKKTISPKLKESIVLKLHNLQKSNDRIISLSMLTKQDNKNTVRPSFNSDVENEPTETIMSVENISEDNDGEISIEHLQRMSNSLLHQSNADEESRTRTLECEANTHRVLTPNDPTESVVENEMFDDHSDEGKQISDLDTLASNQHTEIVETVTDPNMQLEQNLESNDNDSTNIDFDQEDIQNLDKERTCVASVDSFKGTTPDEATEKLATESEPQEMDVGASENRASIYPTLRQQILQPSSLFHSSILSPPTLPSLGDLLSGNSQLPHVPLLGDITSSISNLFEGNERAANDEELSSSDFDPNTDCTDDNPVMSTDASTSNSKSILPELHNPFEDINLDIFQLNPLSHSDPLAAKIPSLNLNSFKTKLAVPKTFNLRPVKLQSSLGRNGNILGATLSFEPSKMGAPGARISLFRPNVLNRKPSEILGNPLGNQLDLEELRDKMRVNTENLLNTPLGIPRIDPLETLQATKTLSDNIRSHTENTVRNLQQSLASTLNEARVNTGEKLAKPKGNLLEVVSNAHEDMKDKLLGIHTDLKDRLETLQDHIKEQTILPPLRMSPLSDVLNLESPLSEIASSSNMRASQPTKVVKSQRKPGFRVNKPSQKPRTGQVKPANQQANLRPFKMSKAASSLTPKSVEVPKLTVTSVKPPFAKPLERNLNVKLRESKLNGAQEPGRFEQNRRPLLTFADNGRSFSSTNSRPVSSSALLRPKSTPTISSTRRPSVQSNDRSISRMSRPKPQSRFNFEDTSGYASNLRPSIVKPNTKPNNVLDADNAQLRSSPSNHQRSSLGTSPNNKTVSAHRSEEISHLLKNTVFNIQKPTESSLMAKLRQSLKSKSTTPGQIRSEGSRSINDMAKSASDDNSVILNTPQKPMKENVTYKCKMVCYRES